MAAIAHEGEEAADEEIEVDQRIAFALDQAEAGISVEAVSCMVGTIKAM